MDLTAAIIVFLLLFRDTVTAVPTSQPPNIVFLMGESVASSGLFFGEEAPMPIPNLQWLMKNGVSFPEMYSAAPVCNPSRATTITGRHAHKLGHYQLGPSTGLWVNGSWNNHEGLSPSENNTFFNFTKKYANYQYATFGKTDWTAGLHTPSSRVYAWTSKVNFPYTLNDKMIMGIIGLCLLLAVNAGIWYFRRKLSKNQCNIVCVTLPMSIVALCVLLSIYKGGYGFYMEDGPIISNLKCTKPGSQCSFYKKDWDEANLPANWIRQMAQDEPNRPFLAYWGSTIVHPPYRTTSYWLSTVNESMVKAPEWIPRDQMHPEDAHSSMSKKMFGPCCSDDIKIEVRSHYYALIAEYDAMIGLIIDAIRDAGVLDNTFIIATSDHGDMKMEHTQYYKMVHWDSSSKVPAIIYGGNGIKMNRNVIYKNVVASMLDWFPTIMEMAGIDWQSTTENVQLDGYSLMPFVIPKDGLFEHYDDAMIYDDFETTLDVDADRPNYVMSQFHGALIRLSWFLLRQNEYKYVVYGSGTEVAPRLFNLKEDPGEMVDLAGNDSFSDLIESMDSTLLTIVDYPVISENVEMYNKDSFVRWRDSFESEAKYEKAIWQLRWSRSWTFDSDGCLNAIEQWLGTPNNTFEWAVSHNVG